MGETRLCRNDHPTKKLNVLAGLGPAMAVEGDVFIDIEDAIRKKGI
jgi:hypothetical protein